MVASGYYLLPSCRSRHSSLATDEYSRNYGPVSATVPGPTHVLGSYGHDHAYLTSTEMIEIPQTLVPTMTSSWRQLFQLPPAERSEHRIHLVGIGGTGLAPIAKVLLELGFQVSGSDREPSSRTKELVEIGAHVLHRPPCRKLEC